MTQQTKTQNTNGHAGFNIKPATIGISYEADLETWAILSRALSQMDSSRIEDNRDRAAFTFWRDGLRAAVISAIGQSWADDKQLANLEQDIVEYLK